MQKKPAIFEINAKSLIKSGFKVRKKGKVYTTDFVPPEFLRLLKL